MSADTVIDRVLSALPGTSREIARKIGVSVATANRWIRAARDAGKVERKTRHLGKLRHTYVYQRRKTLQLSTVDRES